jgi:hypothetical protein
MRLVISPTGRRRQESVKPIVGLIVGQAAQAGPTDILTNYCASTLALVPDFLFLVARTGVHIAVNTIDPLRLIEAMVCSLILRQTGVIVNISSSGNSFQFSVFPWSALWKRKQKEPKETKGAKGAKRSKKVLGGFSIIHDLFAIFAPLCPFCFLFQSA